MSNAGDADYDDEVSMIEDVSSAVVHSMMCRKYDYNLTSSPGIV
jgi:hypothetical protein